MRMAGEEKNLMGLGELANGEKSIPATLGIKVDENIVEHHRKRIDMRGVFANQSETHSEIKLLRGTPAQELRWQADAIGALNQDIAAIERCNHAVIAALGHHFEKDRC